MPSFFKDLRRRSRASFKPERNADSASSNGSNDGNHEASSQSAESGQSTQSTPHLSHERTPSSGGMSSFFGRSGDPQALQNSRSQSSTNLNQTPYGSKTPPMSSTPPLNGSNSPHGRPGMPSNPSNRYSIVVNIPGKSLL